MIWRYIIKGYLNVNIQDKYKIWLKNAIGCNTGSTTRTELVVASKVATTAQYSTSFNEQFVPAKLKEAYDIEQTNTNNEE